jgi:hypothetical protein
VIFMDVSTSMVAGRSWRWRRRDVSSGPVPDPDSRAVRGAGGPAWDAARRRLSGVPGGSLPAQHGMAAA